MSVNGNLPAPLKEIVDDFQWCDDREKLELLLQYSDNMPALPEYVATSHEAMDQVHECMTPVFIQAEKIDGRMEFYFDVPAESPTVRGFAAILGQGLNGATPEDILKVPNDFYLDLGLENVLTYQRLNGLSAILAHIKRLVTSKLDN